MPRVESLGIPICLPPPEATRQTTDVAQTATTGIPDETDTRDNSYYSQLQRLPPTHHVDPTHTSRSLPM